MKKNYETIRKSVIIVLLIGTLWFLWQEVSFAYALNTANDVSREGDTLKATRSYVALAQKYPQRNDVIGYNAGVVAYQAQNYTQAKEFFDGAADVCQQGVGTYCGQIFYNTGNAQYRLGEQEEEREDRVTIWEESITSYEKTLALDAEDVEAQENIDFIRGKMQEEEEQEQQESDESQEGEDGESGEEGEEGESSEGEGRDGEEQGSQERQEGQEGEEGEGSESSEGQQGAQEQGQEQGASQPLDQRTNAEVEAYMQQMQQNEQQMQEYFSQNPDAQNANNPNGSLDPLLEAFFGNRQNQQNFNQQKETVEKDW